ncbi:uncharacterized protein DNG_06560 [Cephalotrichum gorgonifer]|uniref:DUF2293 domain-containing protein n=1 Tax=Cephalotrichum gorgonifer TaxID=2041049 RepID=A0AAE8N0K0_9PEZI|nr:uncharacterized protein DNG_06560 [Cephalotrichum gorgonifer]
MEGVRRTAVASDGRDRPKRAPKPIFDRTKQPPAGLVAKSPPPQPKLKHQSYFEFVENTNKKKPLEYQITLDREPPPGFTFVPIGKPELTGLCKELSREKEVMIFMVSTSRDYTNELSMHTSRIGHHIREAIVDEARASLGHRHNPQEAVSNGTPEPIPETQEEINAQADAAIRELFPRIPNTDRQQIIDHAFRMGAKFHGEPVVGLIQDISLSRRVQLAVLAHIRHRHTRYDALLRETTWQHARKTVEAVCLDMIVKWRGDEENGRDNLDSILREVVVISDSEEDEDDDESDLDSDELTIISPPKTVQAPKDAGVPTTYVHAAMMPGGKPVVDKRAAAQQAVDILHEIATILNCNIDRRTLSICISMIENGVNPEALSSVIKELRQVAQEGEYQVEDRRTK